ncbi:OadG family protein [Dysosmobacter sp.]|uniref:OadG family protein n=1 Tax=Dysosmobacter sp. TaxID=2591382 RepID=UPI002A8C89E4|nr:OadG family protein [Dysosmobacter sp.]MDY3986057.1 OadG family protein [Dysosmobacter sp.]
MDYSIIFVCLMGMGTVFFGLVCLIVLTTLLGRICGHKQPEAPAAAISAPAAAPAVNQQELIAALSAAIAEELGTDITGIRILSVKKL